VEVCPPSRFCRPPWKFSIPLSTLRAAPPLLPLPFAGQTVFFGNGPLGRRVPLLFFPTAECSFDTGFGRSCSTRVIPHYHFVRSPLLLVFGFVELRFCFFSRFRFFFTCFGFFKSRPPYGILGVSHSFGFPLITDFLPWIALTDPFTMEYLTLGSLSCEELSIPHLCCPFSLRKES